MTNPTFSFWSNPNGGVFSTGHNWSPAGVPNSGSSDAVLGMGPGPYTVTSNLNETLDALYLNFASATLAINGGTFSVISALNPYSNVYNSEQLLSERPRRYC